MPYPLMPKATAVWLVENTTLSFEQIGAFCGMHPLEIQGIADGEVAVGANMENACYRLGVCGEIAALTAAQQAFGLDKVARIAVAGGHVAQGELAGEAVVTSCGGCRQSILEAAQLSGRDVEVISANGDGTQVRVNRISELIPWGFGPDNLKDAG